MKPEHQEPYSRSDSANRALLVGLGQSPDSIMAERFGRAYTEYRCRWEAAGAFTEVLPGPLHLDVDTNYTCNLSCVMCPLGRPGFPVTYAEKRLPFKLYRRVLAQGVRRGLAAVRLGITGEPLLRPDIVDFVAAAHDLGVVDIMLITNGLLLTKDVSRRLMEAGLTRLMVSLDAATPDTYRAIRRGGRLEDVVANVETFLKLRREMKSPLPLLRVSFVKMSMNIHEQEAFRDYWTGRADYVSFQEYANIMEAEETSFFVDAERRDDGFRCPDPWQRLSLFVNGDFFPCCSDFGRLEPVGNAASMDLEAAWNSPQASELRRLHRDGQWKKAAVCRRCAAATMPGER